jgi:uncharacterized damage-inducible protein DinB
MIRSIADFEQLWTTEALGTQKLLDELTDASLAQEGAPGFRTLGRIAWHLVVTVPEMLERTGLEVTGARVDSPPPTSAAEIANAWRAVQASALAEIRARWVDETLDEEDDMYGERWTRGATLTVLVLHQAHHRGQMTVLMRQAGLPVPGVYGPSRDEWAQWGAEPPVV